MSASEAGAAMSNTVTIGSVNRLGWQCPGCKVHYSPDVHGCQCAAGPGATVPVTVWPSWYWPYSVPGCAPFPVVYTYNANLTAGPSASLSG